ncbi:gamma-glutamyl hydrolase-like [Salvelinus alpinus]
MSDFARVAEIFYANEAGDSFPIWGTCLWMQLLTFLMAIENLLTKPTAEKMALPLNLTTGMAQSFHTSIGESSARDKVKVYGLGLGLKTSTYCTFFWSVFLPGRTYPFYGIQCHPEVNRFQWDPNLNFPYSSDAVHVASFFNEGRRNLHHTRPA